MCREKRENRTVIKVQEPTKTDAALSRHGRLAQPVTGTCSLDLEQLDVKDQRAVGRDAGHGTAAISKVRGDGQTTLTTD